MPSTLLHAATDYQAMGLHFQSPWDALNLPRPTKRTRIAPVEKKVYIQMTKTQKAASAFMTRAERKAWRAELAAQKAEAEKAAKK